MEWIEGLVGAVNTVLWDYALLFLLVATGIYFTVRLGFVQYIEMDFRCSWLIQK